MARPRNKRRDRDEPTLGQVVLDDLRTANISGTFRRDLDDLYRFYLSDERREELAAMGRFKRMFWFWAWLAKSLLLKLSPVRRLLLLSAVLMLLKGDLQLDFLGLGLTVYTYLIGIFLLLLILALELKDKLLVRDELEVGRQVQLALMPSRAPQPDGWSVWSHTQPANDVGGDLIDFIDLHGPRVGVALGDVAGKGLGAALLMAKLQATLRATATDVADLSALGARLNHILHRDGLENRFATMFYFEMTPGSGRLKFLNAGHNPAMVLRAGKGPIEELKASSVPLGMMGDTRFSEESLELIPGEMLIAYSDGLTEARNASDEEFGSDRLAALLPSLRGLRAAEAGARVLSEVREFSGETRLHDDLTIVVAALHGPL